MAGTLANLPPDIVEQEAERGKILVVDDEPDIRESLEFLLSNENYRVDLAANATEDLRRLEMSSYDLVLLDLMMPDKSGMQVLEEVRVRDRETPIFMITAYGSVEVAVDALKRGANDYFPKPWDNEKLLIEIDHMIAKRRLERENTELKRALKQRYSFPNIVGKSERMLKILDLVGQVAASRATILITGETGTGKELIANAIHAHSARAEHPFVPVHSGSVPPDLLESALFGHVRGAFTGALAARKGYFEVADQGTIFFDEIGTISLETQTKLLRVIQEREFMPLGSAETVRVNVRIVAATNADLKKFVEEGKFREDLYYRLNVVSIEMPPLRDRKDDIVPLALTFIRRFAGELKKKIDGLDPDAQKLLMRYNWPGNIRELENTIERAILLAEGRAIASVDLRLGEVPTAGSSRDHASVVRIPPTGIALEDIERHALVEALKMSNWVQKDAAELLSISPRVMNYKIKTLGIEFPRGRRAAPLVAAAS
jgi:DNA-binding NtrC family response regulator